MDIKKYGYRFLLIASTSWGLFPLTASAEPEVTTQYKHYDIYPQSLADIRKQMKKHSPIKSNGRTFYGNTKWSVRWGFDTNDTDNHCRITRAQTYLDVTYTLPRIPASHHTDDKVRAVFKNYYIALVKHERNHMKSGLFAAQDIKSMLLDLEAFENCSELNQSINSKSRNIIKKYNQRDIKYDKKTKNGRTEGLDLSKYR